MSNEEEKVVGNSDNRNKDVRKLTSRHYAPSDVCAYVRTCVSVMCEGVKVEPAWNKEGERVCRVLICKIARPH